MQVKTKWPARWMGVHARWEKLVCRRFGASHGGGAVKQEAEAGAGAGAAHGVVESEVGAGARGEEAPTVLERSAMVNMWSEYVE